MQVPYETYDVVENSPLNRPLTELRRMPADEFREWAIAFRNEVTRVWDELGIPPGGGMSVDEIIDQFKNLARFDLNSLRAIDELTWTEDCIFNFAGLGSGVNQFFPTMLKTRDISQANLLGSGPYDFFADQDLEDIFVHNLHTLVTVDGVGSYSAPVEKLEKGHLFAVSTGVEWIKKFEKNPPEGYAFWLVAKHKSDPRKFLTVSADELDLTAYETVGSGDEFIVRYQKANRRVTSCLRPLILRWRLPAVNFNSLTARFLYEEFTKHIAEDGPLIVYDPSAGWGGRIVGAMATHNARHLHYVGTDPNSDNYFDDGTSRYSEVADFFNDNVTGRYRNTYEVLKSGSEEVRNNEAFKAYRGRLDFVFTSPPYFAAEGYSDEETQSYKKFPTYAEWRDGFLKETLKTCVEWLKPQRWLCWNIADVTVGSKAVPLEYDTREILRELGMEYRGYLKMVLRTPPGRKRQDDKGRSSNRHFCQVNGRQLKYEPVFMFWKP
jgi:hypothetical protein